MNDLHSLQEITLLEKKLLKDIEKKIIENENESNKLKEVKKSYYEEIENRRFTINKDLSNFNDNALKISNLLSEVSILTEHIQKLFREKENLNFELIAKNIDIEKLLYITDELHEKQEKQIEEKYNEELQDYVNILSFTNNF